VVAYGHERMVKNIFRDRGTEDTEKITGGVGPNPI